MKTAGKITAIWLKRAKGGPMDPVVTARLESGKGLVGNTDQGGKRQVTIIAEEAWRDAMAELGADVSPTARRANILVHDIELNDSRRRVLQIGDCRFRVYDETRPCERMDEACPGLRQALRPNWRGGISCEVLDDGEIHIGDPVRWVDDAKGE